MSLIILAVGIMVFAGHFFSALFRKTGIPDVLLFMIIGILLGPYVFSLVTPEDFGKVGPVITTIALIIILFEGGININIRNLQQSVSEGIRITIITFIVTILVVTGISRLFLTDSWILALLTGAILAGTSSAVVLPMISVYGMKEKPRLILFLESALTDVLCIVFAFAFMEAAIKGEFSTGGMIGTIISSLVMASVIGMVAGFAWSAFLNRVRQFPNTFFTIFAVIFIIYGLAEILGFSGAISALAFGITLANLKNPELTSIKELNRFDLAEISETEKSVYAEAVFLLKIFFFIFLGVSLKFSDPWTFITGAVVVIILYAARIAITRFTLGADVDRRDSGIVAVMIPKGLAAAVLASIPAQKLIPGSDFISEIVYTVILISIIFSSVLVPLIDRTQLGTWYSRWLNK